MKRVFDFICGLILLIALGPIMILVGIAIRLNTPGPALFRQVRMGQHQKPYTIYKFRTMHANTGDIPTHEVGRSAVTKLGGFLRKTKLDELPQLINVVKGEMSFVGPRPCLPSQTHIIEMREEAGVFDLKPGITGASQVEGVVMDEPRKLVDLDIRYKAEQSFATDFKMLIQTVTGSGQGDRVK